MKDFKPNYQHLVDAALNKEPERIPLYEHNVCVEIMEEISNRSFGDGDYSVEGRRKFFKNYNQFFLEHGYDTVTYEACITLILPGGGALGGHVDPVIKNYEDFQNYPWDSLLELFIKKYKIDFDSIKETLPEGMKVVGGIGNGVFEIAQDLVGFENLMLISYDDERLYQELYRKIGDIMIEIWTWFLEHYSDIYCVCRFGDDLGYKTNTLLPPNHIKQFHHPLNPLYQ